MSRAMEEHAATGLRRFKPYPEYKDSGVEWLGEIPAHWELKRLKYLASINDEALPEGTDPNLEISYVDIGNVDSVAGIVEKEALVFEDAPSRARRIVRDGDLIVSTVRTYLRAIAAISDPEPNLIVSTGFAVVRPKELETSFNAYAVRAPYFVDRVVANSVGVSYPSINASEVACFPIAYPEGKEQRAIAAFLDRETARIDALVAKKERLIELLQEKRTSLITRAVTKGLDPNVPMKNSGIERLGEIPAHWAVKRLKYVARLRSGEAITSSDIEESGEYPVYGGNGLRGYTSAFTHDGEFPLIGRQGALCGCINYARGRFWASEHAVVAAPNDNHISKWLGEILRSMSLNQYSESAAQPGLAVETINGLLVPVPPNVEQSTIAAHLDCETSKIDALVAKVRDAIDRLKELRTALISAAVAGKIDVRGEAT